MSRIMNRLLAFTRYGEPINGRICTRCFDAELRGELASLTHARDIETLDARAKGARVR